jgi:methyl-accepting chemotaxis protein
LSAKVGIFRDEIQRLARSGVPARDLFRDITKAQDGLDAEMAKLEERFRDSPALLEKLRSAFRNDIFGGFAKDLDASVRNIQSLNAGSVEVLSASEIAARGISAMRDAVDQASDGVVTLTGDVNALAQALQNAALAALLASAEVGRSANLSAAPLAQ